MRIFEILIESKSADLFHGTSLEKAERIVASNKFVARTRINTDDIPKKVGNHNLAVSFTRDPSVTSKFTRGDFGTDVGVVFVLDQGLLSRDLGKRLQPYNDVDTQAYKDQAARWGNQPTEKSARARGNSESEEIVFGDLTNANKYIKKIILLTWNSNDENANYRARAIRNSPLLNDPRTVVSDGGADVYTPKKFIQSYSDSKEKPVGPPGFLRKNHNQPGY